MLQHYSVRRFSDMKEHGAVPNNEWLSSHFFLPPFNVFSLPVRECIKFLCCTHTHTERREERKKELEEVFFFLLLNFFSSCESVSPSCEEEEHFHNCHSSRRGDTIKNIFAAEEEEGGEALPEKESWECFRVVHSKKNNPGTRKTCLDF